MAMTNGSKVPVITAEDIEKARGKRVKLSGRPSKYNAMVAAEICQRLEAGETLTKICKSLAMPMISTVYDWEGVLPEFAEALARARRRSAHTLADDCIDIVDKTTGALDLTQVRSAEIRSKTRLELAKFHNRSYFGDKVLVQGDIVIETMADRIKRLTGASVEIPAEFRHIVKQIK
jgi:hypothetical protein